LWQVRGLYPPEAAFGQVGGIARNLVVPGFVKNQMRSKKRRQAKEKAAQMMVSTTAVASSNDTAGDAFKSIKLIKNLAAELGGMKKLSSCQFCAQHHTLLRWLRKHKQKLKRSRSPV
jgi:hypothetical protein